MPVEIFFHKLEHKTKQIAEQVFPMLKNIWATAIFFFF